MGELIQFPDPNELFMRDKRRFERKTSRLGAHFWKLSRDETSVTEVLMEGHELAGRGAELGLEGLISVRGIEIVIRYGDEGVRLGHLDDFSSPPDR